MAQVRFTLADLHRLQAAAGALEVLRMEVAEFMQQHAERTGVADFLDVVTGDSFDVAPDRAISYFQAKGLRPTFHYADMLRETHDQAFTVAKMMDVDMLSQVRESLDKALAGGQSFGEWKKGIEPFLKAQGWWGRQDVANPATGALESVQLGSAWRLETIFRTNMQSAYAAGQWQEIQDQKELAPFLLYDAVDDFRTRPEHRRWNGTVLPVDHPWWKTHFPPCGYNCRCGVIQLSEDDLAGMGVGVTGQPPDDGTYLRKNPRTDKRERIPNGVDPGFENNAGEDLLPDLHELLEEKIDALPDSMRQAVVRGAVPREGPDVKKKPTPLEVLGDARQAYFERFGVLPDIPKAVKAAVATEVLRAALKVGEPLPADFKWSAYRGPED
jgi:SPP1 gp7 family putative phage head morphogenesis protein